MRSIQSLAITESNYAITIDVLKEKFDCHRQICMRHWDLIFDYPKIIKETPEAIDDLIETVKVNLQALEKLGDPVTSNAVLLKLFTSKLPSAIIRKWQRTLPDKKLLSYTHLVDFLKTRTNGDRTSSTSTVIKRASDQHNRQRPNAPRSYAFTIIRWCVQTAKDNTNYGIVMSSKRTPVMHGVGSNTSQSFVFDWRTELPPMICPNCAILSHMSWIVSW